MKKVLSIGAEATVYKNSSLVVKSRGKKSYRHPLLDEKIRKLRTRSEAKILDKLYGFVPVPKVFSSSDKSKEIELEFISGEKLAECFDKLKNFRSVCKQVGVTLSIIHDNDIVHGDLTTSNLILSDKKVFFIDFGLGYHSQRAVDKAVDLHVFKEALQAKHPSINVKAFSAFLDGYKSSKNFSSTIRQFEKVELRGRYKQQH